MNHFKDHESKIMSGRGVFSVAFFKSRALEVCMFSLCRIKIARFIGNMEYFDCLADDRFKGKQHGHVGEKDVISIVKLAEIIKETMQVFWEFLRADKCEANFALKGVHGPQTDTAEIKLFMNVKLDLRKKERKLKDVQRSGNCIVKKFQKQQEHRLSHHSLFASLVELKLVSRVISLPRLRRDYLVWCQRKLSNINVAGRKVSMEQSFSLFPC
ncbi:hypothetical protein CQW23_25690 [Capsicum baccatum]|uniref:Uncharacterized protein n=1 Tax=Capsicum baccatum TaxID=33114 RepID=A0A2G2VLP5_CAPBA|nr:hypothetical protein CQW23_25690 [Capsicum baccatum]